MSFLESLLLIVVVVFLALVCYFIVYWYEQGLATYEEKKTPPTQVAANLLDEKKQDRKFQLELLKLQIKLEGLITLLIGFLAIEFALFFYYGTTALVAGYEHMFQLSAIILIFITFLIFAIVYRKERRKGFKKLEKAYL